MPSGSQEKIIISYIMLDIVCSPELMKPSFAWHTFTNRLMRWLFHEDYSTGPCRHKKDLWCCFDVRMAASPNHVHYRRFFTHTDRNDTASFPIFNQFFSLSKLFFFPLFKNLLLIIRIFAVQEINKKCHAKKQPGAPEVLTGFICLSHMWAYWDLAHPNSAGSWRMDPALDEGEPLYDITEEDDDDLDDDDDWL